jgi:ribosomal protein S18 acetylase RimI-like enzyme
MGLTINGGPPPEESGGPASRTLGEMGTAITLSELTSRQFLGQVETALAIYTEAMDADPALLPGRRELMRRHASYPAFRALQVRAGSEAEVAGFAYGFHGQRGQWWYDAVWNSLVRTIGAAKTADWLTDCLEVAEVHVRKQHQRHGIGTEMLTALTDGRPERTAVLSTPDRDTTARRLYRRMGFTELLTGSSFPGGSPPYIVMGAELPLRDSAAPRTARPISASPSIS